MTIDPEFKALIPALEPGERQQLEENLIANGCRDALVLWHDVLIDGHNRFEICSARGITFRTVEIALESREHVLLWIEENQLGRRNLSDDQRSMIALSVKDRRVEMAIRERNKQNRRGTSDVGANVTSTSPEPVERSRAVAAKGAKISEHKLRQAEAIRKVGGAEVVKAIRNGDRTIREARAAIKTAAKEAIVEKIRTEPQPLPGRKYRVIVVDPPWQYAARAEDPTHRARNPYPSMSLDDIRALPVGDLAAADCVLWLWTTNAFIREAFPILEAWGFTSKTILTWVKPQMGTGDWLRGRTEHCVMAVKGKPVVTLTNQTTALAADRGKHSEKPEEFYALVEALCPGSKLELFARKQRNGWQAWGAEAGAA